MYDLNPIETRRMRDDALAAALKAERKAEHGDTVRLAVGAALVFCVWAVSIWGLL